MLYKLKDYYFALTDNKGLNKSDIISITLCLVIFIVLVILTWARWGSPVVDCGRELYVAEQLLDGKFLYSQVYYLYGPLTPYVFALIMLITGKHILAAYFTGILLSLLYCILLYFLSRSINGPFISGGLVLLTLFLVFNPYIFNFIFPYSYSILFGTVLSLIMLSLLITHMKTDNYIFLIIASIAGGLIIVTKPEFIYFSPVLLTLYLFLTGKFKQKDNLKNIAISYIIMFIIPFLFFILIIAQISIDAFIDHLNYMQLQINTPAIIHYNYSYLLGLGTFQYNLKILLDALFMLLIIFFLYSIPVGIFFKAKLNRFINPYIFFILVILALLILLFIVPLPSNHPDITNLFWKIKSEIQVLFSLSPFISIIFTVFIAFKYFKTRQLPVHSVILLLFLLAFLLFCPRYMFNLNIFNYGAYFMPLFFIPAAWFLSRFSSYLYTLQFKNLPYGDFFSAYFITLFVSLLAFFSFYLFLNYSNNIYPVTTDRGTIKTGKQFATATNGLIDYIKSNTNKDDKIILLPEESLIYFITDRQSATKFYDYLPFRFPNPELEKEFISKLASDEVKLISISNRDTSEYGYSLWGRDYYTKSYSYILNNYNLCATFGNINSNSAYPLSYNIKVFQKSCP